VSYIYINEKPGYHPQVLIIYDLDQRKWSATCSSFCKDLHATACMFMYRPCSCLFSFVTQLTCWLYHLLSFGGKQTACILFMVFL